MARNENENVEIALTRGFVIGRRQNIKNRRYRASVVSLGRDAKRERIREGGWFEGVQLGQLFNRVPVS